MHRVAKEGPILVRGISLHLPFSHSVSRVHGAVKAVSPQEYSTLANDFRRGTCCLFICCSVKVNPSRVRIASPRYLKRVSPTGAWSTTCTAELHLHLSARLECAGDDDQTILDGSYMTCPFQLPRHEIPFYCLRCLYG